MGVVRRAHPIERAIVAVLIVVDLFPASRHDTVEGVFVRAYRLEEIAASIESGDGRSEAAPEKLQEESPVDTVRERSIFHFNSSCD